MEGESAKGWWGKGKKKGENRRDKKDVKMIFCLYFLEFIACQFFIKNSKFNPVSCNQLKHDTVQQMSFDS